MPTYHAFHIVIFKQSHICTHFSNGTHFDHHHVVHRRILLLVQARTQARRVGRRIRCDAAAAAAAGHGRRRHTVVGDRCVGVSVGVTVVARCAVVASLMRMVSGVARRRRWRRRDVGHGERAGGRAGERRARASIRVRAACVSSACRSPQQEGRRRRVSATAHGGHE